jgi:Mrp family chromosome partitioning ATPase
VPVSDSIPIAKLVPSVVLVVRVGSTPKGAIKRAIRVLSDNGSHPVGIVANGLPQTRTSGAHGYYYSYSGSGSYSGYSSKES